MRKENVICADFAEEGEHALGAHAGNGRQIHSQDAVHFEGTSKVG